MKMNKSGFFLAEETLKIVIAVIVIIFLIYFLASLYFSGKDSEDMRFAKESLGYLNEQISLKSTEVQIYNPKGWLILSWPYQNENKLPFSCSNLGWKSCICIVKDINLVTQVWSALPFTTDLRDRFLGRSNEDGTCLENTLGLIAETGAEQKPIIIGSPVNLKIDYDNKKISAT